MLKLIVPALFVAATTFGGAFVEAKTPKAGKKSPATCCATKKKADASACCAEPDCCVGQACDMGPDCCAPGSDCCVDGQCTKGKKVKKAVR